MRLQIVGCSHHNSTVQTRERLAFSPEQTQTALRRFRDLFPGSEAVLLSTCNRVELYLAAENQETFPTHHDVVAFLADFHGLDPSILFDELFERTGEDAVRHLFTVAASLDSMVVGEAQILSQVKQAYELAQRGEATGPVMNLAFQAAIRAARRVARETAIQQKRVSIPSVAVGECARQFFERFDNKQILVIGAGEMGEETLRYLVAEGAREITIVNRSRVRAERLAREIAGQVADWEQLDDLLVDADLVVSTTGATEPIITAHQFRHVAARRGQRVLLILDLAVPRDFDAEIAHFADVYLYSIDDLSEACEQNRREREREWPQAERIIEEEAARFMAEMNHRATGPTIRRLQALAEEIKQQEIQRLMNRVPLDERLREEVQRSFDRLVNKLLHPPLESLRGEAREGTPHGLIEALKRLFKLG